MDAVLEFGLETTRWLQTNYPQLAGFFIVITSLGEEEFFLAAMPLIYWCINKRLGKGLGVIFFVSIAFNSLLKHAFRGPRPFWLDESLELFEAGGYGVPSGHTQYAATLYLVIAAWLHRGWAWILAIVMVILMGLSRIFLGVHFVHDVVAGAVVGLLIVLAYFLWKRYADESFRKRILGQRMLAMIMLPVVLALIYVGVLFIIGEPNLDVAWAAYIPAAELDSYASMATAVGTLLGFGVGILLEGSRVRFRADGPLGKRAARYVLGIAVTVGLWLGLGLVFPDEPLWLGLPLRVLRYGLVTLWAGYYAPMMFVRLRLADADPPPEISMKL